MTQGIGPKPMENDKTKTNKLTNGNQPKLFTVASDTKTEAAIVVADESNESNAEVVFLIASTLHSSQSSYSLKNMATPAMEIQMNKSDMRSRTFLPNFSMIRVVKKVPATWIAPTIIALKQESISLPEL